MELSEREREREKMVMDPGLLHVRVFYGDAAGNQLVTGEAGWAMGGERARGVVGCSRLPVAENG